MDSAQGFDLVTIRTASGDTEAAFVPGANMLCCSLRHQGTELLHAGSGLEAYAGRGKTTGVPLLYPWANRLAGDEYEAAGKRVSLTGAGDLLSHDPNGLAMHGLLPGHMPWRIGRSRSEDRLTARLKWASDEQRRVFPYAHELAYAARVREGELEVAVTVRATGGEAVPVSFGFHPYLCVPGGSRRDSRVTIGAFRRLVLDERSIPTGERVPLRQRRFRLGGRSLDDGFDALAVPPEFSLTAAGTTVCVTFELGYHYAQVYAPPDQDFVCFEPMTAPTNALVSGDGLSVLEPGEEHRTVFSIRSLRPPSG